MAADGIVIRLVIKTVPGEQWAIGRELRRRIKHAFDQVGIEIPFPQRTVWIRSPEDANGDSGAVGPASPARGKGDATEGQLHEGD